MLPPHPQPPKAGVRGAGGEGRKSSRLKRAWSVLLSRRLLMGAGTTKESATRQGEVARLLMQHRAALYGYIFACVRNHADAEDILQNVCVAVTESFEQLTSEGGFLPWAREITRRRILAHRRTAQRETPLDPDLVRQLAEAADRVEQEEPASEQWAALTACLEGLPPASRLLIASRYD